MTELLFIQLNLSDANDVQVKQDCQNSFGSLSQIKLNAVKKPKNKYFLCNMPIMILTQQCLNIWRIKKFDIIIYYINI